MMLAKINKSALRRFIGVMIAVLVGILLFSTLPALAKPSSTVNVSGIEVNLGRNCTIDGVSGACGVKFIGWTSDKGVGPNNWVPFPGNGQGGGTVEINYTGKAGFNTSVTLTGGTYEITANGRTYRGRVTGGSVQWPDEGQSLPGDQDCGPGIAYVDATLNKSFNSFKGCLYDLPIGQVIPPKIWGTFSK